MFNVTMALLIILGVVFGGGATTVAAAQTAQPEQPLYPVKIWSEDIRLGWETDSKGRLDLGLQFTARRADEISAMLAAGASVPEPVLARFENQQRQALEYAAGMPDELVLPALEQVRNQARQQEQIMMQLQVSEPTAVQIRTRVQIMLQTQAQTAQQGIEDPLWLREQLRLHERIHVVTPGQPKPPPHSADTAPGSHKTHGWKARQPLALAMDLAPVPVQATTPILAPAPIQDQEVQKKCRALNLVMKAKGNQATGMATVTNPK